MDRQAHWEKVYATKAFEASSWYQKIPETSFELIHQIGLPKDAPIIDIGAGESFLVDELLKNEYTHLSVLDISEQAIANKKQRMEKAMAQKIHWHVSDVLAFEPSIPYALWHDRAAFHFLTNASDIQNYVAQAHQSLEDNGHLIVATFSKNGPTKCSGIEVTQYDEKSLEATFSPYFHAVSFLNTKHITPSGSEQAFIFGHFVKSKP